MSAGFLSIAACALAASLAAQQPGPGALRIRKIVLYKHGVGFFERRGTVDGSVTVPLSFKAKEMKDVLKSLYVVDLGGGHVSSILYDSKDPVSKQLEDILFQVPEQNALTRFLAQLKGARVRVAIGAREVEGSILGIEPIQKRTETGTLTSYKLVLLTSGGAIHPVELLDAQQVTILDEEVRKDLGRMMEIYAKARHADRKVVTLRAEGTGQRELRVGYILETPIWKTAYRLLLEGGTARLQGWAIVENRTDEDWKDVELSFVAGSPLSFVLDLYTSYYPRRPVLQMSVAAAEAYAAEDMKASMMRRGRRRAEKRTKGRRDAGKAARPGGPTTPGPGQPPGARALGDLLAASMAPVAQGVEVGELFAYEAKAPVTIRRGQAALVPILFETLREGKRVLYWRGDLSQHPSHAFRLENSTRLTLEKGPVTVFEASACLGEGMLRKTLRPGMHVILPYALETGVEVEPRPRLAQRPVSRAVLANGILTLYRKAIRETRYEVRNKTGEAWTLYLDHPKAGGGFRLVAPAKAAEELAAHQRFLVEVPAQGKTALAVREEREVGIQVQVRNQRTEQIGLYLKQGYLSDPARSFLAGIVKLMDERTALDREIAAGKDELQRLNRNQDRLRRDLGVLRTTPREQVLRDKYLDKLLQGSDRIEELNRKTTEASRRRRALDERIARDLGSFRE